MIDHAFTINKRPLPWTKAISAGICSGIPVLVGLLAGKFEYGLMAGIGSFTYLYVFNIPYAQRAKKLFFALLGMSISVGLGTLLAPFPIASALVVGLIGAIATFIFGALRIAGPAAIFFVLGFAMATGMAIDPSLAPFRAGLVSLGGGLAWVIGMVGWLRNPYGPEIIAIKKTYQDLAHYIDSVGTNRSDETKRRLVSTFKSTEDTLSAGYAAWRSSEPYIQLILLYERANEIFVGVLDKNEMVPPQLLTAIRNIAVEELIKEPLGEIDHEINISKPSLKRIFNDSFNRSSLVLLTAIRYGVVLSIAAIVAYSFDFNRSYWITLSCAAVMSGSSIISTFHRAIQRSLGTVVGILIATIILFLHPEGIVIVIAIVILTFLTELAIVLNYAIAVLFITPNALLLAESTTPLQHAAYFTTARITDVVIGSVIGLIGTLLIGRRQASGLLSDLMVQTIRSQQQYLFLLFSKHRTGLDFKPFLERNAMKTHSNNLRLVYTTALGEMPSRKIALESFNPAIDSIEHLGYLLEACQKYADRPTLSDESLAQLLLVFETMAAAIEHRYPLSMKHVPEIQAFSKIQQEIIHLQKHIQMITAQSESIP
ncbi:FUSC family protein [Paenibacillus castaneae]|uniref:FUSC family protein n=1 Tax=Paenibacillus castaneae TaxID=474957 RepID=UPI001FB8E0B3|nr:FUSC family protein [Paenibacillus castaneae]